MRICIIVAASENNIIGKDNQLLWHLPADMKFFKAQTIDHPVIMGRKTFDALNKPLPQRTNIIITRNPESLTQWKDQIILTDSLYDALAAAKKINDNTCYIIGGGDIYRQVWLLADVLYLTRVHTVVEGDTSIPEIDETWHLVEQHQHPADERHAFAFTFETYNRI